MPPRDNTSFDDFLSHLKDPQRIPNFEPKSGSEHVWYLLDSLFWNKKNNQGISQTKLKLKLKKPDL